MVDVVVCVVVVCRNGDCVGEHIGLGVGPRVGVVHGVAVGAVAVGVVAITGIVSIVVNARCRYCLGWSCGGGVRLWCCWWPCLVVLLCMICI